MQRERLLHHSLFVLAMLFGLLTFWPAIALSEELVSRPGEYSGYAEQLYDDIVLTSQYVAVTDGTKLAVDIFRPAVDGAAVDTPYPVLFLYNWARRANYQEDHSIRRHGDRYKELAKYGYVIAVADARGTGVSYGTLIGSYTRTEARDTFDLIEWFGDQPWSDGNVGMLGCSHVGQIEYMAASTMPPSLRAIFPACFSFDLYFGKNLGGIPNAFRPVTFKEYDLASVPVDEDTDGRMKTAALEEHLANTSENDVYRLLPYRDSWFDLLGSPLWIESSPVTYINEIEKSGIPIYHWGNWTDFRTNAARSTFLFFRNLDNPDKISMGPLEHCKFGDFDLLAEYRRFFDYWIKGIDNGIMEEPPVYYYTTGAQAGEEWRFAWQWPLPNEKTIRYYLGAGPSGSAGSVNNGTLTLTPPTLEGGRDDYAVDYSTNEGNMDERGLTYTTGQLAEDIEITGYPVIHLWVSSTATDGDFFVYLEDVDDAGEVRLVLKSRLRASFRALNTPPFDNFGLPWRRNFEEDTAPLIPGQPVELIFDPLATSTLFKAGHRIRLTMTCATEGVTLLPPQDPPPNVGVYRNAKYPSYISLPVTTDPFAVNVRIEPSTLTLKSQGLFTVFITVPGYFSKGYRVQDIDLSTLTCGGAPAVRGEISQNGHRLIATFDQKDLRDISTGDSVRLTVEGEFNYEIPFEGSDEIRVTRKGAY